MPLTEAQPWNVCYSPEAAYQSVSPGVEFLAARHPGARNCGWGQQLSYPSGFIGKHLMEEIGLELIQ